jgi:modification methylase
VVVTARPWREHGELVDLPGAVIAAGTAAGLVPAERCVALLAGLRGQHLVPRPSFFQLDNVRKARARGEPWHLIVHEDVLVFTAPATGLSPAGLGEIQPGHRSPVREAPDVPGTRGA